MPVSPKIAPCLWFASEAEEAARFYVSLQILVDDQAESGFCWDRALERAYQGR